MQLQLQQLLLLCMVAGMVRPCMDRITLVVVKQCMDKVLVGMELEGIKLGMPVSSKVDIRCREEREWVLLLMTISLCVINV
jgi:hypothetical protein